MESAALVIAIVAVLVVAAVACAAFHRSVVNRLTGEAAAASERAGGLGAELGAARDEAASWRTRFQAEEVAKAKAATEAARLPGVEAELTSVRGRLEVISADRAGLQEQASRVPELEAKVAQLSGEIVALTNERSRLTTMLAEQAKAHEEKLASLVAIRAEIEKDLKNIATDTLRANQDSFLKLANEVFEKHKEGAAADIEARQKAVEQLVAPVKESLQACQLNLSEREKTRLQAYASLTTELRQVAETQLAVRSETSKLVNALRAAPKTRGRWGEHTLRNVLELSGLSSFCDFTTEESFARDGATLRPDVIIRLPGGRNIVIDAKTSTAAYLDAFEAVDDDVRERHLALHAAQIRTHVKQLAGKAYWDGLAETPDFVVMFVPGDNFYAAAAERDPKLFEEAVAQRVLIVTPATLIALAKAVAFGWRQEKVAENAKRVHDLGRELYKRLSVMGEHIAGVGDSLGKTVKKYNQFVGSLEGSVMPHARRFNELELEGTSSELPAVPPLESEPRPLRPERDIVLPIGLPPTSEEPEPTASAA